MERRSGYLVQGAWADAVLGLVLGRPVCAFLSDASGIRQRH